jgi:hypothetical protein
MELIGGIQFKKAKTIFDRNGDAVLHLAVSLGAGMPTTDETYGLWAEYFPDGTVQKLFIDFSRPVNPEDFEDDEEKAPGDWS